MGRTLGRKNVKCMDYQVYRRNWDLRGMDNLIEKTRM